MATIVSRRLLQQRGRVDFQPVCDSCRGFTSYSALFSGHNRWSTIRHDKAKNDKAKSKERAMVSKEISSATQSELSIIDSCVTRC